MAPGAGCPLFQPGSDDKATIKRDVVTAPPGLKGADTAATTRSTICGYITAHCSAW